MKARPHFRTQQEILDRILDAVSRGDQGDEFNEYMRCARFVPLVIRSVYEDTVETDWMPYGDAGGTIECEDVRDVDHTAKILLAHFERAVRRQGTHRVMTIMRQYRAYKWLLGHEDADTFLDRCSTPLCVYKYLMKQITRGKWDKMTANAKRDLALRRMKVYTAEWNRKRKEADATKTPVNAQAVA